MNTVPTVSVIIPTYKHPEVLVKNLRHNLPYLQGCEIIVVNDDPEESICELLDEFVEIKLIENKTNKGFSGAVNTGATQASGTYLFLLNNDVKLLNDSYKLALTHFQAHPHLFGVSCAQKEHDGRIVGKNEIYWSQGMILHRASTNTEFGINAWAEGGSAIIDHKKFKELHGFDELFSPFYWEDVDLSYRAWKAGYEVFFEPGILVEHHHETTISSQFSKEHIKTVTYRNQLIFQWKNLSSWDLILKHKLNLSKILLQSLLQGDTIFLEGWFQAVQKFMIILGRRPSLSRVKSDHEILEQFTR